MLSFFSPILARYTAFSPRDKDSHQKTSLGNYATAVEAAIAYALNIQASP